MVLFQPNYINTEQALNKHTAQKTHYATVSLRKKQALWNPSSISPAISEQFGDVEYQAVKTRVWELN